VGFIVPKQVSLFQGHEGEIDFELLSVQGPHLNRIYKSVNETKVEKRTKDTKKSKRS
jgi:hypothetical protein